MQQLEQFLQQIGVDLTQITDNAEVRRLIQQASESRELQDAIAPLFQDAQTAQPEARQYPQEQTVELGDFVTGQPVTFDFAHNTDSATAMFG